MTHSRRVLIGGVGYRWQGDASFGLVAADALARLSWPAGIEVADLGYGALLVTQDLLAAAPPYERLIVLAAASGAPAPRLHERRWDGVLPDVDAIQERIREAGAGIVELDHLLVVADYFGALPKDVRIIELEHTGPTARESLSVEAEAFLPELIERVRAAAMAP